MLPLPLLDTTDVTARAAAYEGYNDNVVELPEAPGAKAERRGSPFTGLELELTRATIGRTSAQSLSIGARGQHYTPFDGRGVGGDDGALSLRWSGGWDAGWVDHVSAGQSFLLADQNATRLSDLPLTYVDASIGRRTFVLSSTSLGYQRELGERDRVTTTLINDALDVLHDNTPLAAAPGIGLVAPRLENAYTRDLGPNDAGTIRVMLGYSTTPNALLDTSGRVGAMQSWQVSPALVWSHALSESWRSEVTGGVSLASTQSAVYSSSFVAPAAGWRLSYAQERRYVFLSYGLGLTTMSPSLGLGMSHSLGAQWGGPLGNTGVGRDTLLALTASASRTSTPVGPDTSLVLLSGGVGAALRYALSPWLGLLGGYEARYVALGQTGPSAPGTDFYRNLFYVGLSGSFSSNPDEMAIDAPRPPPR